jgi:hypothetical protein
MGPCAVPINHPAAEIDEDPVVDFDAHPVGSGISETAAHNEIDGGQRFDRQLLETSASH